jgi:hypothetical protein
MVRRGAPSAVRRLTITSSSPSRASRSPPSPPCPGGIAAAPTGHYSFSSAHPPAGSVRYGGGRRVDRGCGCPVRQRDERGVLWRWPAGAPKLQMGDWQGQAGARGLPSWWGRCRPVLVLASEDDRGTPCGSPGGSVVAPRLHSLQGTLHSPQCKDRKGRSQKAFCPSDGADRARPATWTVQTPRRRTELTPRCSRPRPIRHLWHSCCCV